MSEYITMLKTAEKRRDKMRAMRAKGKTLAQIANVMGVSRQRVHQLTSGVVAGREFSRSVDKFLSITATRRRKAVK